MFEFEVDHTVYTKAQTPQEITAAFENGRVNYPAESIFQWEEHCTECAMPLCYITCDLYEPRKDGKCRRFIEGMAPIIDLEPHNEIVQVTFKKWGSLMATGYLEIVDSKIANKINNRAAIASKVVGRQQTSAPSEAFAVPRECLFSSPLANKTSVAVAGPVGRPARLPERRRPLPCGPRMSPCGPWSADRYDARRRSLVDAR